MRFIKTLLHFLDKTKMGKLERIFISSKSKAQDINPKLNYKYIKTWVNGRMQIECEIFNYLTISNHLRNKTENYRYQCLGERIYHSSTDESELFKSKIPPNLSKEDGHIYLGKKTYEKVCNKLSNELSSLPNYIGKCYRTLELDNPQVYSKKIKHNDLIMDKSFLATSLHKGRGQSSWGYEGPGINGGPQVYFIIKSKTGKNINKISNYAEEEILFNKKTIFQVEEIKNYSDKTFYIYLEEISNQNQKKFIKDIFTGGNIS